MDKTALAQKSQLNKIGEKFSHYFYGKTFPMQVGLIISLCYVADKTIIALLIASVLASFIFVFYKNLAPIFPLLIMIIMSFTNYDIMNDLSTYPILLPAATALLARLLFIYPIKWKRPNLLVIALILVSISFAVAGITREDYDFTLAIAYFVSLGPVILIVYLLFSTSISQRRGFCIKKYLCYSLLVAGLVICLEIAYLRYVVNVDIPFFWAELGWCNVNSGAAFLLLSIPACYYLMIKSRVISPFILCTIVLYGGMLISGSDAALGITIFYTPILLLYTYRNIYRTKRKVFSCTAMVFVILVAVSVIVLVSLFGYKGMLLFLQIDTSGSGRDAIYIKAIELFRENPIFGYGFNFSDGSFEISAVRLYNFHSTFFHVLATMGLFGIISYALYFIARFKILLKSYSPFTMTMLCAFIMFESYAMVDTGEFNAIPLMCTVTLIITVVEWATKKENKTYVLPLSTNKRNGYYF